MSKTALAAAERAAKKAISAAEVGHAAHLEVRVQSLRRFVEAKEAWLQAQRNYIRAVEDFNRESAKHADRLRRNTEQYRAASEATKTWKEADSA